MRKKSQDSLASLDCKLEALSQKVEKLEEENSISQPHSKINIDVLNYHCNSVSFMIAASVFFLHMQICWCTKYINFIVLGKDLVAPNHMLGSKLFNFC